MGKICTESVAQTFLSSNATTYNSSYTINANRCLTNTATKILGGYVNVTNGMLLREEDLYAPYIGAYGGNMYAYNVYLAKGMFGPYVSEFTFSRKQYTSGYWSGLNSGSQPSLIKVKNTGTDSNSLIGAALWDDLGFDNMTLTSTYAVNNATQQWRIRLSTTKTYSNAAHGTAGISYLMGYILLQCAGYGNKQINFYFDPTPNSTPSNPRYDITSVITNMFSSAASGITVYWKIYNSTKSSLVSSGSYSISSIPANQSTPNNITISGSNYTNNTTYYFYVDHISFTVNNTSMTIYPRIYNEFKYIILSGTTIHTPIR